MLLEGGGYDDEVRVAGMVKGTVCDTDLVCIAVAVGAGPAHGDVEELLYMLKNEEGDFLTVEGRCLPELCQAVVGWRMDWEKRSCMEASSRRRGVHCMSLNS